MKFLFCGSTEILIKLSVRNNQYLLIFDTFENQNIEVINLLLENKKVDIKIFKSKYSCMYNEGS